VIIRDGKVYRKASFEDEGELRKLVEDNYELLFGEGSLYISRDVFVKTPGGSGSVPDGFALNPRAGKWYVVEVERKSHSVWGHIIPQATRHLVAAMNPEEKRKLKVLFIEEARRRGSLKKLLGEQGEGPPDLDRLIEEIIEEKPSLVIVIDGVPQDLTVWTKLLDVDVSIVEVEKYESEDGETLYNIPDYVAGLSVVPEEEEEPVEEPITREKFLENATKAISNLYQAAERLAEKYPRFVKLEPRLKGVSLRLKVSHRREYRTLFTIYPDAFYIMKDNMEHFSRYYGPENAARFLERLTSIRAVKLNYDLMTQPRVEGADFTEDEAEAVISALEEMITARQHQQETGEQEERGQ
jgi:hypothetical protein